MTAGSCESRQIEAVFLCLVDHVVVIVHVYPIVYGHRKIPSQYPLWQWRIRSHHCHVVYVSSGHVSSGWEWRNRTSRSSVVIHGGGLMNRYRSPESPDTRNGQRDDSSPYYWHGQSDDIKVQSDTQVSLHEEIVIPDIGYTVIIIPPGLMLYWKTCAGSMKYIGDLNSSRQITPTLVFVGILNAIPSGHLFLNRSWMICSCGIPVGWVVVMEPWNGWGRSLQCETT
jgi:hypothetical protein